jgi:monothiol glutaredoxin
MNDALVSQIETLLKSQPVLLFMKGTPDFPMCGFSAKVSGILKECKTPFATVNILEEPELREGLKVYANWPTFPQLYIGGELIGGCDITVSLHQSGELQRLLEASSNKIDQPA